MRRRFAPPTTEGDSDWSDPPGSGQTNLSTNTAPTAAAQDGDDDPEHGTYTFLTWAISASRTTDSGAALAQREDRDPAGGWATWRSTASP